MVNCAGGLLGVGPEAHLHPGLLGFTRAAGSVEKVDQLPVRLGGDVSVADATGQLGSLGAQSGDVDRRRLVGQRVDAGMLDGVVGAVVEDDLAGP